MRPDWFVIMQEWVKHGHGDRGVTLPVLVGAIALRNSNSKPTPEDAQALLSEMIANPVDDYCTDIGWCSTLGAPVLAAVLHPRRLPPILVLRDREKMNFPLFSAISCRGTGTSGMLKAY